MPEQVIEFAVLHSGQEFPDLGGRVNQGRPGRIPGVAEGDCPAGQLGYLDTASVGVAGPALAPACHRQLVSRDAVRDLHRFSPELEDEGKTGGAAALATTVGSAA